MFGEPSCDRCEYALNEATNVRIELTGEVVACLCNSCLNTVIGEIHRLSQKGQLSQMEAQLNMYEERFRLMDYDERVEYLELIAEHRELVIRIRPLILQSLRMER